MIVKAEDLGAKLSHWLESKENKCLNVVAVPYEGWQPLAALFEGQRNLIYVAEAPLPDLPQAVFLSFEEAMTWQGKARIIVVDELNAFPVRTQSWLRELLHRLYHRCDKLLSYAMEARFKQAPCLQLPDSQGRFITEPRLFQVDGGLGQGIPKSIFDFLDYFKLTGKACVFYVSSPAVGRAITSQIQGLDPDISLACSWQGVGISEGLKSTIYFTDRWQDFPEVAENFQVVAYLDEFVRLDYRHLVFLCGRAGLYDMPNGEVLFLVRERNFDLDQVRRLTRDYNRMLWQGGGFSK